MKFNNYWKQEFSNLLPFCHHFRFSYNHRWFRVHNLPKSKRYADSEEEYQILLDRQNQLFDTIFGEEAEIMIVFGIFTHDITNDNYAEIINYNEFEKIETINLSEREPDNYEDNIFLDLYVKYTKWHNTKFDEILKAIANDEIRMLFVYPSKNRIIAPYDGGVDILMENKTAKDEMKTVYKHWLSNRKDSL